MRARQATTIWAGAAPVALLAVLLGAAPVFASGLALGEGPNPSAPVIRMVPAQGALTLDGIAPGQAYMRSLEIHNDSAVPVRYRVLTVTDDRHGAPPGLGAAVQAEVRRVGGSCTPEDFATGAPVAGPAALSALDGVLGAALPGGRAHHLCIRLVLDPDASNALQGAATDAELRVVAES